MARAQLEAILHPRIRQLWRAQMETWRAAGHRLAVVVIPLLFETQAERELDGTLCVACSARTQFERLRARGWSETAIQQRLASQWPAEKKIAVSTYVLWTEGTLALHAAQLDRVLARFLPPPP